MHMDVRTQYECAVHALGQQAAQKLSSGESDEQVAYWMVAQRNLLRRKFRGQTPPEILKVLEAKSLERYGDPLGPSIEQLRRDGKSWARIISSAGRPGKMPWPPAPETGETA
ncbi:MAG: hemagglutinin [Comamonadaceae bacterium]|nr:MAG: hemagglutinin [Comamonadaceae bacterium]